MKTPTEYGSENEESAFISRVATPDRAQPARRQKARTAVVGAAVGILAASAVVGYATVKNANNDATPSDLMAQSSAAAAFVTPEDDTYYPSFEQLDTNGDGEIKQDEQLAYLKEKAASDLQLVQDADIPDAIKDVISGTINDNLKVDIACSKKAFRAVSLSQLRCGVLGCL
ncbi:TPA: hypothetical protein N0F65_001264 [Lagenidium giganteum]|uniref:EF-hand domain-containing protein n=1 Tax=Lagenidium giganteum TaxID=4803 RepID=A0AAV2YSJ8_9STRA|nr:TPA: hypothetical protein N0F65_001264 [Lagenidium giganteum]